MYLSGLVTFHNYSRKLIRLHQNKKYLNSNYANGSYYALNQGEREGFIRYMDLLENLIIQVGGSYELICPNPY
ncbi:hypothetical protein NBRC116495_11270 [Aurantivibrio plasticivorans]